MRLTRSARGVAAVVGLGLVMLAQTLAACGQARLAGDSQPGTQPEETVSATPGSNPPPSNPPPPPGALTPSADRPTLISTLSATKNTPYPGEMTLRGEVHDGVEAGCLVLRADNGASYLLLGGNRQLIGGGERIEVVGKPQPGLLTTCQQGIPFAVSHVRLI